MAQAPKNGNRIRFVDFPPDESYLGEAEARMRKLFEEVNDESALTVKHDSPHPMMHRAEAIDYCIVVKGEMTLVLDDSEVLIERGSVVVQRGRKSRVGQPLRQNMSHAVHSDQRAACARDRRSYRETLRYSFSLRHAGSVDRGHPLRDGRSLVTSV